MRRLICAALLFTIAAALGCDGEQLSKKEKEAQTVQNEKVKTALENQGRQPLSKPPELEKNAAELTETDGAETPLVAAEVLGAALKSAKAENKAVLVHFTADW